jgi:SAM-dependent methyltransferase
MICPNCRGPVAQVFDAEDENRKTDDGKFRYERCSDCGVISLANPPDDLGRYYTDDYFTVPTEKRLEQLAAQENNKIGTVIRFARGGRLLEIGPATGAFAVRAAQEGFKVSLIEQDARCCEFLSRQPGLDVMHADAPHELLPTLPAFDVIALWHVIEHLREPFRFMDAAAANLAPGGILVLATPNPQALQFRWMGRHWPHLDAPRHLFLLPVPALIERGKRNNLDACLADSDDWDARRWNRFGWQRFLMNRLPFRLGRVAGFVVGAALSLLCAPWETAPMRGSAYTLVLRKFHA